MLDWVERGLEPLFGKKIVYKTNDELDCMGIEDIKAYAKLCHNIASDRISNDTSSIGEVCVLSIYLLYLFILNWTFCYIISMYDDYDFLMYSNKYIT